MAISKKKYILNTVSVDIGCSSSCRTPRLAAAVPGGGNPKHKPRQKTHSTSSSFTTTNPTLSSPPASYSSDTDSDIRSLTAVQGFGVAVEKDSDDPYLDFRRSMLQMILEKEIYNKDDLKELLNCFLQLNSSYYHGIIVRAFTEIWNGVYSVRCGAGFEREWKSRDF